MPVDFFVNVGGVWGDIGQQELLNNFNKLVKSRWNN